MGEWSYGVVHKMQKEDWNVNSAQDQVGKVKYLVLLTKSNYQKDSANSHMILLRAHCGVLVEEKPW